MSIIESHSEDERELTSAVGDFYIVKDACMLCGVPVSQAPCNISWNMPLQVGKECPRDMRCCISKQPDTQAEVRKMVSAAKNSCVAAIRYAGRDPAILLEFASAGCAFLCDYAADPIQKPR